MRHRRMNMKKIIDHIHFFGYSGSVRDGEEISQSLSFRLDEIRMVHLFLDTKANRLLMTLCKHFFIIFHSFIHLVLPAHKTCISFGLKSNQDVKDKRHRLLIIQLKLFVLLEQHTIQSGLIFLSLIK